MEEWFDRRFEIAQTATRCLTKGKERPARNSQTFTLEMVAFVFDYSATASPCLKNHTGSPVAFETPFSTATWERMKQIWLNAGPSRSFLDALDGSTIV